MAVDYMSPICPGCGSNEHRAFVTYLAEVEEGVDVWIHDDSSVEWRTDGNVDVEPGPTSKLDRGEITCDDCRKTFPIDEWDAKIRESLVEQGRRDPDPIKGQISLTL